jgi:hypothetical protein
MNVLKRINSTGRRAKRMGGDDCHRHLRHERLEDRYMLGREKGTFYFFLGRPRGRSVDSNPKRFAASLVQ